MELLYLSLFLGILLGVKGLVKGVWENYLAYLFNGGFAALLITLGAQIGSSPEVLLNIGSIGLGALLMALLTAMGAMAATDVFLQKCSSFLKTQKEEVTDTQSFITGPEKGNSLAMALFPILFIIIGGIFGFAFGQFLNIDYDLLITIFINILVFGVGIELGNSKKGVKSLKSLGPVAVLMPLVSLLGSLVGGMMGGMLLGLPSQTSLAIGAGSGFYSVTGPLVTEALGSQFGTLALLANFFREILALVLMPLVAIYINRPALIALGGATSMDTTLPVIVRTLGGNFALLAIVHGIILTFLVPLVVPLFLKI